MVTHESPLVLFIPSHALAPPAEKGIFLCGHKGGATGDIGAILLLGSCMKQGRFGCVGFVMPEPRAGLGAVDSHVFSSH